MCLRLEFLWCDIQYLASELSYVHTAIPFVRLFHCVCRGKRNPVSLVFPPSLCLSTDSIWQTSTPSLSGFSSILSIFSPFHQCLHQSLSTTHNISHLRFISAHLSPPLFPLLNLNTFSSDIGSFTRISTTGFSHQSGFESVGSVAAKFNEHPTKTKAHNSDKIPMH